MAATENMAPSRATTPTRTRANGARTATPRRRTRAREDDLEHQITRLQDDLKAIAGSIATLADDKVSEARGIAKTEAKKLVKSGEQAVDQIQDEFGHMEKQIKDTIREKPLTAVAGAVAIGFVLALITR